MRQPLSLLPARVSDTDPLTDFDVNPTPGQNASMPPNTPTSIEPTRFDPFSAAIASAHMAMLVTDARRPDNPLVFVNPAFTTLTGYEAHEALGRNCRFLQGEGTDPEHVRRMREAIGEGRDIALDVLNYRRDGSAFWNALYISPVRDPSGEIVHFFGAQLDASDKKAAEFALHDAKTGLEAAVAARTRELTDMLGQKSALLHEVDHRVKNNLQLIASLILLQIRRSEAPEARDALHAMLARVSAISLAHRRLFQEGDVERFDMTAFLRDLMDERGGESVPHAGGDALPPVAIPASKAASVGLIVNELLTYASAGGPAERVTLSVEREDGGVRIQVRGGGLASSPDPFGREIVDLLARQLRAEARFEARDGTRRACLSLPIEGV